MTFIASDSTAAPPAEPTALDDVIATLQASVSTARRHALTEQLAAGLEQAITGGALPAGTLLPPEPELARRIGLSRQTVNLALTRLAGRGLLIRRRGIGTFVAERAVEQPLDRLYSFVRTLAVDGEPPAVRLLGTRLAAEPEIARALRLAERTLVFELSRLFSLAGAPFAYERVFLPPDLGARLPPDRLVGVIDELLHEFGGVAVTHGEETLRIGSLARAEAALLRQPPGEPAFLIERTAFAGDHPIELRRTLVRGDRTRFRVRLAGPFLTPEMSSPE
jgi:GntR family transcriptional regulator